MSHVDDGELTAYADGAYPANDPDALRISAHLSACDNCRTRFEQAHALRDRAAEILGYATPAARTAPSFETLAAQLATSPAKTGRHFNYAWAATIIMALGLGWFGRGAWQNPPTMNERATPMQAAAPAQDVATEQVAVAPPAEVPAPQVTPPPQSVETPRVRARQTDAAADMAKREAAVGATAGRASVAAAPPPAAPRPVEVAEGTTAQAREVSGNAVLSAADAERQGVAAPRIPELPVRGIVVGKDTTVVDQLLPDGKVVRLTVTADMPRDEARRAQRNAAPQPATAAAQVQKSVAAPTIVSVRLNGKVITVTGDLPADSLRALAQKIK